MKIKVDYVFDNNVQFTSNYGVGIGKLIDVVPQLNQDYYVEFEIREIFSILDFNVVDTEKSIIKRVNDKLLLTMQLIDYEDTGCASFMLGDTVIDIETKYHDDFKKLINKYLSLQVADLYLYSVDIF